MGRDDCRERRMRDCKYRKKCKCKRKCKRKCPPVTLKILTDLPATLALTRVWEEFAEKLRVNSLGTIEVELMRSTEVDIPGAELQDRIANDTIPVGPNELVAAAVFSYGQNWGGSLQEFGAFFTAQMPFGMDYEEYMTWFNVGGGREVQQQVYDNVYGEGVIYSEVFGAAGGAEAAGFFPTSFAEADLGPDPVEALKNLQGAVAPPIIARPFTFRIQGIGGRVLEEAFPLWNVTPGVVGESPLTSLCRKDSDDLKIDGFEFSDANTNDQLLFPVGDAPGISPVDCGPDSTPAPIYHLSGWHAAATVFRYIMNTKYHNRLSPFQKRVLEQTLRQCTDDSYRTQLGEGAIAVRDRKAIPFYNANLCLRTTFSDEVVNYLQANTKVVMNNQAGLNPNFDLLLNSYKGYMENTQTWILNNVYNESDRFEKSLPAYDPNVTPVDNCP